MVHADGHGGDEGKEVEELPVGFGIVNIGALASLEVDDKIERIDEHVFADGGVHGHGVNGGTDGALDNLFGWGDVIRFHRVPYHESKIPFTGERSNGVLD